MGSALARPAPASPVVPSQCPEQPISDNVGGVKVFFEHTALCTLKRAPFRSN
jgi:hypothetical protein